MQVLLSVFNSLMIVTMYGFSFRFLSSLNTSVSLTIKGLCKVDEAHEERFVKFYSFFSYLAKYEYCIRHGSLSAKPLLLLANAYWCDFLRYNFREEFRNQIQKTYVSIILRSALIPFWKTNTLCIFSSFDSFFSMRILIKYPKLLKLKCWTSLSLMYSVPFMFSNFWWTYLYKRFDINNWCQVKF